MGAALWTCALRASSVTVTRIIALLYPVLMVSPRSLDIGMLGIVRALISISIAHHFQFNNHKRYMIPHVPTVFDLWCEDYKIKDFGLFILMDAEPQTFGSGILISS